MPALAIKAAVLFAAALPSVIAPLHKPTAAPPAQCQLDLHDQAWRDQAVANWRQAERTLLRQRPSRLPIMIMFDASCTYRSMVTAGGVRWSAVRHDASVVLPNGQHIPVGPVAFADPEGFFVMGLPSVWRAAGITSKLGLERLIDGVFLHEMSHTRQFYFVTSRLATLTKTYALSPNLDDDSLQDRFAGRPGYEAAYRRETDTLFAAAAAPDDRHARALAGEALAMMDARHRQLLSGDEAPWAKADDIFLTMEGLGQWLVYSWYTARKDRDLPASIALPEVRRGGRYWSQDEGLALFLVVDRLVPEWQHLAFGKSPLLARELLSRAARPARRSGRIVGRDAGDATRLKAEPGR